MRLLSALLFPISVLYGTVTFVRNKMFDCGILPSEKFDVPVICVGNLSVGGTGKTPHTEYLAQLLSARYRVAVLSRGYKRKSKGFVLADERTTARELGDEPYQIKRKFPDIKVAVDADRRNGITRLMQLPDEEKPEVIILDDAFQHRYVKPTLSLLLTDCNKLYTSDYVLPAGRLREWKSGSSRADIIIVTKCKADISDEERKNILRQISPSKNQRVFFTYINYGELLPVFGDRSDALMTVTSGNPEVILLTGIANPLPLKNKVEEFSSNIDMLSFPDHHDFSEADIRSVENRLKAGKDNRKIVVTTEKDAVRLLANSYLSDEYKGLFYYLPIKIDFCGGEAEDFDKIILNKVVKNNILIC